MSEFIKNKRMVGLFIILLFAAAIAGILFLKKDTDDEAIFTVTDITYTRSTGTVSPEYYRQVTYTIDENSISYLLTKGYPKVDGTYEAIAEKSVDISDDDFQEILSYIDSLNIQTKRERKECVGGGTTSLEMHGTDYDIDGYYAGCGPKSDGNLTEDPQPLEEYLNETFFDGENQGTESE